METSFDQYLQDFSHGQACVAQRVRELVQVSREELGCDRGAVLSIAEQLTARLRSEVQEGFVVSDPDAAMVLESLFETASVVNNPGRCSCMIVEKGFDLSGFKIGTHVAGCFCAGMALTRAPERAVALVWRLVSIEFLKKWDWDFDHLDVCEARMG